MLMAAARCDGGKQDFGIDRIHGRLAKLRPGLPRHLAFDILGDKVTRNRVAGVRVNEPAMAWRMATAVTVGRSRDLEIHRVVSAGSTSNRRRTISPRREWLKAVLTGHSRMLAISWNSRPP